MLSVRIVGQRAPQCVLAPRTSSNVCYPLYSSLYHGQTATGTAVSEYTDTPQYPEILDVSRRATKIRAREEWYDKVTKLPSVEQKMMELNMPKYYGHWSCQLIDVKPTLNGSEFCRFATKTHIEEGIPDQYYTDELKQAQHKVDQLADKVEQLIKFHFKVPLTRNVRNSPTALEHHQSRNFLNGLHRLLCSELQDYAHIRESVVDLLPRIESYWILGGIPPDTMLKKIRRNQDSNKDKVNDPIERSMQGVSTPCLGVRVSDGLPQVIDRETDVLSKQGDIPSLTVDPRSYGFKFRHKPATTVTGIWPSEGKQYGHLFLHTRKHETHFKKIFGERNNRKAILQRALVATFTQAHAHATYLGFGPVTELTYPIVQQSVFSDGKQWIFGLYQLNTCALHMERFHTNPYNNILWLSNEEQLFEEVTETGVKGLNLNLLTSLVAMYIKKGVPNDNPTPYLPLKYVSNHPAKVEYRDAFHKHFLHLSSNRPRHLDKPEIYLWEKIYKVDFKTRYFEPPRRFFEKHYNESHPGLRRMDDYGGPYIPKACRENKKIKFKPIINSEHLYTYDKE